jgi:putative sterol carrier protein
MSDATTQFFDQLARRGHEPLLEKATGTVRFDLKHGRQTDHWLVAISKGDIAVSRENVDADCTLRTDRVLFDGVARGEVNTMAALLRGAIEANGSSELMVLVQRLFPGPAASRRRRRAAATGRRRK